MKHSKAQRKADDAARVAAWRRLTAAQQITELDSRLGIGVGAKRQRKKLGAK